MSYPKSRIGVFAQRYKARYGVRPQGFGHWFFACRDSQNRREEVNFVGMYSQAKAQAVDFASKHDYHYVVLLT